MCLLLVARMATSSSSLACLQADFQLYVMDYLYDGNVLTVGSEDSDKLTTPGLQAEFSVICDGIFFQAECTYC
jgi:hypothetical protein